MSFEYNRVAPGVTHIRDAMGVCMTLIEGDKAALLVDTGYGTEDVSACVAALTDKPVTVLLTHNHHDHALGARWFDKTVMFPEDMADWPTFTGEAKRRAVLGQAQSKGLPVTEADFLAGECRLPYALHEGPLDLGGLTVEVIRAPGHTPGSCAVYVPAHRLLLTGDAWNPCTWVFFEAALPIQRHRETLHRLQKLDFTYVLCSHQLSCYPRAAFDLFVNALTDAALLAAAPMKIGGYEHINTRQAELPEGQVLVFDYDKFRKEQAMKHLHIAITPDSAAPFTNNAAFCVGTGRMGLALQKEYQEQLAMVQELCRFKHIRGHGLFCDDMGIYQPWTDAEGCERVSYNFTYLDRVMDGYRAQGLKPFIELGFMPEKMASGTQTIFYWKGNTTPPADHQRWADMIKATLRHLAERYGEAEVSTWPCEVWNEPNLPGFWENADEAAYHRLYKTSVLAVKEVLPDMRVGGPAICGGATSLDWVRNFLTFCRDEKLPVDFLTRHAYMGESPERKGRYLYHTMRTVDSILEEMQATRDIIDSFPEYAGMEMHVTEFNTSYHPFCPIHDTNYNAALIAGLLSRMGDVCASCSYWTFGDVFEEQGVPSRPFHGGFGMIANGCIPKPTLWTFAFFNGLQGACVHRDAHSVILCRADGSYEGVAWNICQAERGEVALNIDLPLDGKCVLTTETVDETVCNPLKAWHDLGEPASLTERQLRFLRQAGTPLCETARLEGGRFTLRLKENAVVRFTLQSVTGSSDYGYEYGWYIENR